MRMDGSAKSRFNTGDHEVVVAPGIAARTSAQTSSRWRPRGSSTPSRTSLLIVIEVMSGA